MTDYQTDSVRRNLMIGGAVAALAAATPILAQKETPKPGPVAKANPESFEALKALFDAYFKAFSAHETAGVLAAFAPDAVIMGTGPGEIWGGHEEISQAHKHFFEGFDPGKQQSEPLYRAGNIIGDMAWLTSMSHVKYTKGEAVTEFGLNSSVVFEKTGGKWLIRVLHFSNITAPPAPVPEKG